MTIIEFLVFIFFAALLTRTFSLIQLDLRQERKRVWIKLLFGSYAILALLPVFASGNNDPLLTTKKWLNWLLALIYIAGISLFLAIWLTNS